MNLLLNLSVTRMESATISGREHSEVNVSFSPKKEEANFKTAIYSTVLLYLHSIH